MSIGLEGGLNFRWQYTLLFGRCMHSVRQYVIHSFQTQIFSQLNEDPLVGSRTPSQGWWTGCNARCIALRTLTNELANIIQFFKFFVKLKIVKTNLTDSKTTNSENYLSDFDDFGNLGCLFSEFRAVVPAACEFEEEGSASFFSELPKNRH